MPVIFYLIPFAASALYYYRSRDASFTLKASALFCVGYLLLLVLIGSINVMIHAFLGT